jgi:dihydrodipicolinate synthase/N-acetylneuraminate lyase
VSPAPVVFSAVPTLFSSDGEVDRGANRALYKHIADLRARGDAARRDHPYYLPVRPDELTAHFGQVRDAVPDAELYAYLFPERTGVRVPPALFATVASAAGLAGAKLSGSAAAELAGYAATAPGRRILSGDDANPAATMRAGGAGLISGRSSAYPEVYAALVAALGSGDSDAAAQYQLVLDRIVGLGRASGGSSTRCSCAG